MMHEIENEKSTQKNDELVCLPFRTLFCPKYLAALRGGVHELPVIFGSLSSAQARLSPAQRADEIPLRRRYSYDKALASLKTRRPTRDVGTYLVPPPTGLSAGGTTKGQACTGGIFIVGRVVLLP